MRAASTFFCLTLPFAISAQESKTALIDRIDALKNKLAEDLNRLDMRYALSVLEEQAGDIEGARTSVREILKTADDHFDSVIRDAWLSLCLKDDKSAEIVYRLAAKLRPDSLDARLGLQLVNLRQENWPAAKSAGRLALELDRNNCWARSRHAYVLFMTEDFEGALTWYEFVLNQFPDDPEMLLGMGFSRIRLGQIDEGKKLCRQAERITPEDTRVNECLAKKKSDSFRFGTDSRFSYFFFVYPSNVEDIKYPTLSAWGLWNFGLLVWGGAGFTQASLPSTSPDYYHIPAVLGIGLRKPEWSVDSTISASRDRDNPTLSICREYPSDSRTYFKQEDVMNVHFFCNVSVIALWATLFFAFNAQAGDDESKIPALFQASYDAETAGSFDQSLNLVLRILRVTPTHYVAAYRAAWLYYLKGEYEDSIRFYERAASLAPGSIESELAMLLPLTAAKQWKRAEQVGLKFLKNCESNYLARSRLAYVYFLAGKFKEAEAQYRKTLAFYPSDVEMMLGLAWSQLKQRNAKEAGKLFEQILSIAPGNLNARSGLEACKALR